MKEGVVTRDRLGRFALWVVAAIVALMGMGTAPAGAMAPPDDSPTPIYAYDMRHHAVDLTHLAAEWGPPPEHHVTGTQDAVGRSSHGAPTRPQSAARWTPIAYDHTVRLTRCDGAAVATRARHDGRAATVPVAPGAECAAKACSFAGSTVVLMADGGRKPTKDIQVGDKVIATDPETGEQVAKIVEHVFVHNDTVIDLVVDGEVITTTEDHPFWSATDQRFERADELAAGERVLSADGQLITVSGLRLGTARQALAYNLSVEGIHTYHVGDDAILVHNSCFDAQALSDAGRVLDRNGFTAAGRAAQKHGNRPGGFGLPGSKTASSYNDFGQTMLDDLLTAPNTAARSYTHKSYGQVKHPRFDAAAV